MIDEIRLAENSQWFVESIEGEYGKGWNDCNKYWIKVIKDMPKVGEWIPCSERLPEDENPVLVQYYDEDNDVVMAVGWMEYGYLMTYDDRIFDVYEEVAWLPLPEPYKEGEDE